MGLTDYVKVNCTEPRELAFNDLDGSIYALPFVLIALYFVCAFFVRQKVLKKDSDVSKAVEIKYMSRIIYKTNNINQITKSNLILFRLLFNRN